MNLTIPRKIGIIAGAGDIPIYFARKAQEEGIAVVGIGLTDEVRDNLEPYVETSHSISVAKSGKILKTLAKENVHDILILGKVEKKMIFQPQLFDMDTLKIILSLKSHRDKTVMVRVIDELEKKGFHVLDQMDFMKELYPEKGVLTRTQPGEQELQDIEFGLPIAKYMADQEIGQTIVVKNKSVIAVEAVEGTDLTIERGCRLAQGKCTAVKVSRTNQDYRFDSPGVGAKTIEGLAAGGATVLAIEAGRVMLINREQVIEQADRAGLAIVSV